jgi:alpha-amylase
MVKQEGLLEHLTYDAYERRSGLIRILPTGTTPEAAASGAADELGDLRDGAWLLEAADETRVRAGRAGSVVASDGAVVPVRSTRTWEIGGGRLDPRLQLHVDIVHDGPPDSPPIDAIVSVEWSTMLLGGGGNPSAWLELEGERTAHNVTREAAGVTRVGAGNDFLGIAIETTTDHPVDAWIGPIETVSNSEAGFELVYQGSTTLFAEPLRLRPGERWALRISQQVSVAGERFAVAPGGTGAAGTAGAIEAGAEASGVHAGLR